MDQVWCYTPDGVLSFIEKGEDYVVAMLGKGRESNGYYQQYNFFFAELSPVDPASQPVSAPEE